MYLIDAYHPYLIDGYSVPSKSIVHYLQLGVYINTHTSDVKYISPTYKYISAKALISAVSVI